jgi:hypothetical protein
MRILTIFARHGLAKYSTALEELRAYQRQALPASTRDLLVVDNSPGGGPSSGDEGCRVIAGSNRAWEFSAWDDGIAHVGAEIFQYDFVNLVTSAFNTLYTRYIPRIDDRALMLAAGRGVAVGHVDWYDESVQLMDVPSQHWIRSSYFFLPPSELIALGPLGGLPDPTRFFSDDPAEPFRAEAPLSGNFRRYILDWLTGEGTGQGTTWHSRFRLDATTLSFFQAKASAILNEHWLSIRLRRQGCAVVDATWLGTRASRANQAGIGAVPAWRAQLAGRDTDAVPLTAP